MHVATRAASIALLLAACGESAPPPTSAPPPSAAAPPSSVAAPPSSVAFVPHDVVTAETPITICGTDLEPTLMPFVEHGVRCGEMLEELLHRRVGVGGHDVVGLYVRDERMAAVDGPLREQHARFVDGARFECEATTCSALTALHPSLALPDEALRALLEIVIHDGEPDLVIDAQGRDALGEHQDELARLLRNEPVGLTRDEGAVTLRALDPDIEHGMTSWGGTIERHEVVLAADGTITHHTTIAYQTRREHGHTRWAPFDPDAEEALDPDLARILGDEGALEGIDDRLPLRGGS